MKKALFAALAATCLLFLACGDDNSSSADESSTIVIEPTVESDSSSVDKDSSSDNSDTSSIAKDTSATTKDTSSADTAATTKDSSSTKKDPSPTAKDTSSTKKDSSSATKDSSSTKNDSSSVAKDTTSAPKDTSSSADESSNYSISDDGNQIITIDSLFIDETQQIIALNTDARTKDVCTQENDSWVWKSVTLSSETDSFKYEFRGDSLILYRIYSGNTESSNYGSKYIGSTGGEIYQTWTYTQCEYNKETDSTNCYERNQNYGSETITFSPGKYSIILNLFPDQFYADQQSIDYMNSFFMDELYKALNGNESDLDVQGIFMDKKEAGIPDQYGINIIENSRMSQTFISKGKQYVVTVKNVERTFLSPFGTIDNDISIDVTDGDTTCNNFYKVLWITTKERCSEEYASFFYKDEVTDINGNKITITNVHRNYNQILFKRCLRSITANNDVQDNSVLSRKNAACRGSFCKKTGSGVKYFEKAGKILQ